MIYEAATWAAVLVLGPGALAVFGWFLWSLAGRPRRSRRR